MMKNIPQIGNRVLGLLLGMVITFSVSADIKRTASGKPDLSGVYDTGTLTPEQRPNFSAT